MQRQIIASLIAVLFSVSVPLISTAQVQQHVYRLRISNCQSTPEPRVQTAFKLAGSPVLVTALHGLADCSTIVASDYKGNPAFREGKLFLEKVDIAHDVVQLASTPPLQKEEGLESISSQSRPLAAFSTLKVYGFPSGRPVSRGTEVRTADPPLFVLRTWNFKQPILSALSKRGSPDPDGLFLDIDGPLLPGHSGAPLVDENDRVVAVANGGMAQGTDNRCWAIPWNQIRWDKVDHLALQRLNEFPDQLFTYQEENAQLPPVARQSVQVGAKGNINFTGSTGYIPGLHGRLNPILDSSGRTYLYADNIAIEGGKLQPVVFALNKSFIVEDSRGSRFKLTVNSITRDFSSLTYERLYADNTENVAIFDVSVKGQGGRPVRSADVIATFSDGTYLTARTNEQGVARLTNLKNPIVSVYITHSDYLASANQSYNATKPLTVELGASTSHGSVTFTDRSGNIPGLQGRLSPILDSIGRTYLYADNIAIEGGKLQPVVFALNKAFLVEDSLGSRFKLTVNSITSSAATITYEKLRTDRTDNVADLEVTVKGPGGQPVLGADVLAAFNDGTYITARSNEQGIAKLTNLKNSMVSVWLAHEGYKAFLKENHSVRQSLPVVLTANPPAGSQIIVSRTGYIPGLQGRLNPILDSIGRTYLYADNIAIEGGKSQPVVFVLNGRFYS